MARFGAERRRVGVRGLGLAGMAAVASVVFGSTITRVPAQQPAAADEKKEAGPLEQSLALELVDKDVSVAQTMPKLSNRLATIESEISRGWTAHYSGQAPEARGAFTNAMSNLLAIRRELIELDGLNPLVRMRNLQTGRFSQSEVAETYRPFSTYLNSWVSRLPEALQAEMEKRFGSEARGWLQSAVASQDGASLRDLADMHLFTDAGAVAVDHLVELGVEQGNFLDVASWLIYLRECRPNVYRSSVRHGFRLLLALESLGDSELSGAIERELNQTFPNARMMVGNSEVPLAEALSRARLVVPKSGKSEYISFMGLGSMTQFGLASKTEYGLFTIEDSGEDTNFDPWGWNPWGSYQTFTTEYHLEPLFLNGGIIAPRVLTGDKAGESWYTWFPDDANPLDSRTLALSEAMRRPIFENPNRRSRWGYFEPGPQFPFQRVFGMSAANVYFPPAAGLAEGRMVPCMVATMNTGRSSDGLLTGNQIHIFDMARQGSLMMSIPIEAQLAPGMALKDKVEVEAPRPIPDEKTEEEEGTEDGLDAKLSAAELGVLLGRTHFCSVPIIENGRLYIGGSVVSRSASTEFRVFCFDLSGAATGVPGMLIWQTRVSSVKGVMDYFSSRSKAREAGTLVKSGNRILATTNHGSVACVDARDGRTQWVTAHRLRGARNRDTSLFGRNTKEERPVLRPVAPTLVGSTLLASPSDGMAAFSLDACTGTVLSQILDDDRAYEVSNYFLGTFGGRAYHQTPEGVTATPFLFDGLVTDGKGGVVQGKPLKLSGAPPAFTPDFMQDVKGLVVKTGQDSAMLLLAGQTALHRFDATTLAYIDSLPWPIDPSKTDPEPTVETPSTKVAKRVTRNRFPASMHLIPASDGKPSRLVLADPIGLRVIDIE